MPPMANGGMQRGVYGRAESPYNADWLTSAYGSGSSNGSGTATAASFGARILTRTPVLSVAADRVRAQDSLSGNTFDVRARVVINATGVWAGELAPSVKLRPSRGSHLVLAPGTTRSRA